MEILVTGFDPFDGEPINPAWEAVKRLDGKVIDGQHPVHALMIPTVRYEALSAIKRGIERFDPQLMIAVGQAGGDVWPLPLNELPSIATTSAFRTIKATSPLTK